MSLTWEKVKTEAQAKEYLAIRDIHRKTCEKDLTSAGILSRIKGPPPQTFYIGRDGPYRLGLSFYANPMHTIGTGCHYTGTMTTDRFREVLDQLNKHTKVHRGAKTILCMTVIESEQPNLAAAVRVASHNKVDRLRTCEDSTGPRVTFREQIAFQGVKK